jgi:hypothetical protein
MDSEGESRGRSAPRPPKSDDGAPRGRGIDVAKEVVFACRGCGEKHRDLDEIRVDTLCAKCAAPLHACRHCVFFDTSARWECTKPITERIVSKTAANQCEYYSPARAFDLTGSRATGTPDDARSAFDRLFKK